MEKFCCQQNCCRAVEALSKRHAIEDKRGTCVQLGTSQLRDGEQTRVAPSNTLTRSLWTHDQWRGRDSLINGDGGTRPGRREREGGDGREPSNVGGIALAFMSERHKSTQRTSPEKNLVYIHYGIKMGLKVPLSCRKWIAVTATGS